LTGDAFAPRSHVVVSVTVMVTMFCVLVFRCAFPLACGQQVGFKNIIFCAIMLSHFPSGLLFGIQPGRRVPEARDSSKIRRDGGSQGRDEHRLRGHLVISLAWLNQLGTDHI
jgi:hypothetical protein